jgi:TRAP transporter 4TM/12TM fusion protein
MDLPSQNIVCTRDSEETKHRNLRGFAIWVASFFSCGLALFQIYTAGFGGLPALHHRTIFITVILTLAFLWYPASRKSVTNVTPVDWFLAITSFVVGVYTFARIDAVAMAGSYSNLDILVAFVLMLLITEAVRRTTGIELVILGWLFLAYALLGQNLPGILRHRGFTLRRIIAHTALSSEGIFGIPLGTASTFVVMFIIFGAFLAEAGVSKFFTELSLAMAGRSKGGPAKVAVLASALMGTISGSTSANVATTGAFTIPLMKSIGYDGAFAGAVEAVASTGGQIMPPVMGAAAFIMADMLGIPYTRVVKAALIPALLYFLTVWVVIDLRARRLNLPTLREDQVPSILRTLREGGILLLPLVSIIAMLLAGYTAMRAAFWGIFVVLAAGLLHQSSRIGLEQIYSAFVSGIRSAISVGLACAIVGFVVGTVTLTAVGLRIGSAIMSLTRGNFFSTLIMTMLVSVVMGMGLPTSACYIITASIAAPILVNMGALPIAAHFFVFSFGILSTVTPPVAIGAYTAAGLASASPQETGWTALRIAIPGFIVPFMYVYSPVLLLEGQLSVLRVSWVLFSAIIGVIAMSAALEGYFLQILSIWQRIIMMAAGMLLLKPGSTTDFIGFALLVLFMVYIWRSFSSKKDRAIARDGTSV